MADEKTDVCLDSYDYFFRPNLLLGKVALITGGGSGIGFRIAEVFMRHGCTTVIMGRKEARLQRAAERLRHATGEKCLPLVGDVRKAADVLAVVRRAIQEFGTIHILVNNAAGNFLAPSAGLSTNGFRTVLDIDTVGTFTCSRTVYEQCFRQQGEGAIINISATLHYTGQVLQCHAGSAKAAVDAMTKHLAVEWGGDGIRVNSLAPGPIEGTEGFRKLGGRHAEAAERGRMRIPLQRFGTRREIAEAALYLASSVSSYVTGSTLVVDGGAWMTSNAGMGAAMDMFKSRL